MQETRRHHSKKEGKNKWNLGDSQTAGLILDFAVEYRLTVFSVSFVLFSLKKRRRRTKALYAACLSTRNRICVFSFVFESPRGFSFFSSSFFFILSLSPTLANIEFAFRLNRSAIYSAITRPVARN